MRKRVVQMPNDALIAPCDLKFWIVKMSRKAGLLAASCTVLLLAACGGSSSDNDDERPSFEQLASRGNALEARLGALEETTVMPTTGSATYNGVAGFDMGGDNASDMLAELSLQANFADSTVGGKLSNFTTSDGSQMEGELNVADGIMNQQAFDANVSGTLRDGAESSTFDGTMNGAFLGANADAVSGTMNGSMEGTLANGATEFGGAFVAEK